MDGRRNRGYASNRHNGDAMRGVFGSAPLGAVNANKRNSIDGLAARQQAVALQYQQQLPQPETRDTRFPNISPRSVPQVSAPPPFPSSYPPVQHNVKPPPTYAPPSSIAPSSSSNQYIEARLDASDSNTTKLMQLFAALTDELSTLSSSQTNIAANLDILHNYQNEAKLKISTLPTADHIADIKGQLESYKQTLNTSNTLAGNATKKVNKLGLQLFEQQTKLNSLLDLGNSLNQSTMLLDQLSLAVDDLKSSQPNVSEIMNEVNGFRREFHAKHQEEAEFRDATNKKSQVMFNELVRLGETNEKDRGNSRSEVNEIAGIVTTVEKRLKGTEDEVDNLIKSHGSKLINLDGAVSQLGNSVTSFGRDTQMIVGRLQEEAKTRKSAVDNITSALDDMRSGVSDMMSGAMANNERKMATMEEQIRSTMDSVRTEGERSRLAIADEIAAVGKAVSNEAAARSQTASELTTRIIQVSEQSKQLVSDLQSTLAERLDAARREESDLAMEGIKNQEDIKNHLAIMEREVYETQGATNARIERTRAALEEVLRAEIQSRQNNFSSLEGRVRDIVTDAMASLESVSSESRMAVDAIANRVNTLEVSLQQQIDGKISVVEEAVVARQNQQEKTNEQLNQSIAIIHKKEAVEHSERVGKENEIVSRVEVVEERVEGEIEEVRQRVESTRTEVKKEVKELADNVEERCSKTEDRVRGLTSKTMETENNLNILTKVTDDKFGLVRDDVMKNKDRIDVQEGEIKDVDDKIGINNVVSGLGDLVVGLAEDEEKVAKEASLKEFMLMMIQESERKMSEKENEREERSKRAFEDKVEEVKRLGDEATKKMEEKFREDLERERVEGLKREESIRMELVKSIENAEISQVCGMALENLVSKVVEREEKEALLEALGKAQTARDNLEKLVAEERRKGEKVQDRLEELSVVVNEREKMEGIEWAKIMEGEEGGSGGLFGGKEGSPVGSPKPVSKNSAKSQFPRKD